MRIALRMMLPLLGIGIAFAAVPAQARNYDCSKAGNANKTACKNVALAPAAASGPKVTAERHYDCTKAGNANKTACKGAVASAATPAAPTPRAAAERHYDCSKAGNANKAVCKGAFAAPSAPQASPEPAPAPISRPIATAPRRIAPAPAAKTMAATGPEGATAKCRDGSYSHSQTRSGTCSHHGGVATWY
jgi:hypothetical protein